MAPWIERLRERTRAGEQRLVGTSWCTALATNALALPSYVGWLRAWELLYEVVEAGLARAADARLREVWPEPQWRRPVLQRAVASFAARAVPEATRAQLEAMLVAQRLRRVALREPMGLLGALYGLHLVTSTVASRQGVARGLEPGEPERELWAHVRATPADELAARMQAMPLDPPAQEVIIAAAVELLDRLEPVLGALHPFVHEPVSGLVDHLNFEAGAHPITDDLRELQVALRAGAESWQAFPYYEARYAARGLRFTNSDSAWLVALSELDAPIVHRQVGWLGRVLAARGMPRLMLEEHLELLHVGLCEVLPERSKHYAVLREAAHVLRDARREHLPQHEHDALAQGFERAVGSDERARLPRMGELLAAAVADERAGITGAVSSLAGWLTDPARFGPVWIDAVRATIERARGAIPSTAPSMGSRDPKRRR